jgi:hypothetical protein
MKYIVAYSVRQDEIDTWLNCYEASDAEEALYKWFTDDENGQFDKESRQDVKTAYEKENDEVFDSKDTNKLQEALQTYHKCLCTIVVALLTEDSVKQILELQSYCLSSQVGTDGDEDE